MQHPLNSFAIKTVTWSWKVETPCERADLALIRVLQAGEGISDGQVPPISRSQLKRLIDQGCVKVDGVPLKANQTFRIGSVVTIEFPPPQPTELLPEDRELEILFEDEHLVVINKPQGLTVHPSPTQMEGTLVHALLHHIKDLSGIGGVLRPGIVHRIDKDTSGALVITKSDAAHLALAETFSQHDIERTYWALCYGSPSLSQKKIESLIGRNPTDRKKMSMTVKEGRRAVTYFKKLEEYGLPQKKPFASWLEVTLETGRTHQIRVHLTGSGHSILGDPVYGAVTQNQPKWTALPASVKAAVQRLPGQALHARTLGFVHPITKEKLRFEAKPPEVFAHLLTVLKEFSGS